MSASLIGKHIDRYLFLEEVGRGGMAQVYKATAYYVPTRTVAVKVLTDQYKASEEVRARLHQEAQIQCRLTHPNIGQVLGVIDQDGIFALVMEWLEGVDLRMYMRQRSPQGLSIEEIQLYFLPILDALELVHQNQIIHRDIKPANIMLQQQGERLIPKLLDFGIAKMLESDLIKTKEGALLGTVAYISPEQISGQPPSPSMDIYSLGVSLYELLTGRPPFRGGYTDVLIAHTETMPEDIRNFRTDLPDSLNDVLMKALAKKAAQRFPSCAAFRQALEDAFDQTFRIDLQAPSTASLDMSEILQSLQPRPSRPPSPERFPHLAALADPPASSLEQPPFARTQENASSEIETDPMPSTQPLTPLSSPSPLDSSSPSFHGYIPRPDLPPESFHSHPTVYHSHPEAQTNHPHLSQTTPQATPSYPPHPSAITHDGGMKKGILIGLTAGILLMAAFLGLWSLLR